MKISQKLLESEEVTKQLEVRLSLHALSHTGNQRDSLVIGKSIREETLMVTVLNAVFANYSLEVILEERNKEFKRKS